MEKNNLSLDAKIEAFLFYKGEPVSFGLLARYLESSEEDIVSSLKILEDKLQNRGISLIINDKEVMIGTNKELSSFFESLRKEDLSKDLSRASLETLSIILYKQKVSRSEIDYIRGVNSGFILRNLQVRGLIEKEDNKNDLRVSLYKPSTNLLAYLGISDVSFLPNYESISKILKEKLENNLNEDYTN